jgi:hypothetical protein
MGSTESCAIQAGTGKVVCWEGWQGLMVPASPFGTATAIAVGGNDNPFGGSTLHTCVIRAGTGNVVCRGSNIYGQATPPPSVNGADGTATAISAGDFYTLAIAGPARAACQNGVDDDGDGLIDYPADPGCQNDTSFAQESPACQDGIDNDLDGKIDFDGGAAANHGVALGPSDPQCGRFYQTQETPPPACGLGAEVALLMGALLRMRQRFELSRVRTSKEG